MAAWLWYFVLYSFLGFLVEVAFARVTRNPKKDRKCLYFLPLCPVYGLGALAILALPAVIRENPWLFFLGVALAASGNSVARMLGSSSGEARLYIRDGTFSKQMLDLAALNVGSVVVAKLFGENKEVKLRCAVADFAVKDGVAQTRSVKLSTEEAVVEAVGVADLRNEYLDLRIKPESLQWKFFSLRTPLYVRGDFAAPKVGLEAGPLLLRAGAAVAAAVVAPAALALVPITVPAAEDEENCAVLLARANEAVKAGKPGAAPKAPSR